MTAAAAPAGDADVAPIAALIGDRARARVLMALLDGRSLPSGLLATEAGVAASTMSEHLARLLDAGLVTAERQGRARYFRLAGPSVAHAREALARLAPPRPSRCARCARAPARTRCAAPIPATTTWPGGSVSSS